MQRLGLSYQLSVAKRKPESTEDDPLEQEHKKARLTDMSEESESPIPLHHPKPVRPAVCLLKNFGHGREVSSLHSFVSSWIESIDPSCPGSVGLDRINSCRSDTFLRTTKEPIRRNVCCSLPTMAENSDQLSARFSGTPASGVSSARRSTASSKSNTPSSSGKSLVEQPTYRTTNLVLNKIEICGQNQTLPEFVQQVLDSITKDRTSPPPEFKSLKEDPAFYALWLEGADEDAVGKNYNHVFPEPVAPNKLDRRNRVAMNRETNPTINPTCRVSGACPDALYGYRYDSAFKADQFAELSKNGGEANRWHLAVPFLAVEFKTDSGDGFRVALNQCLGDTASCLKIVKKLNSSVENNKITPVVFSFAATLTEVRMYVTWLSEDDRYLTSFVEDFYPAVPQYRVKLRRYVKNTLDWGVGERLEQVKALVKELQGGGTTAEGSGPSTKKARHV